jgi:hypothetical protein
MIRGGDRDRRARGMAAFGGAGSTGGAGCHPGAERRRAPRRPRLAAAPLFDTSHNCMACHNGLSTSAGEDISIGDAWRATMMANSARDPYWQAAVRREIIDHPTAAADIEDECSICHMPMARTTSMALGRKGEIFAHLPIGGVATPEAILAADGVSCTACHQITAEKLGTPESFTGGFVIDTATRPPGRSIFGPFRPAGQAGLMHSATGFRPSSPQHVRQSELCATCHTLYTHPVTRRRTARPLPGAGAVPRVAPQRLPRRSAAASRATCPSSKSRPGCRRCSASCARGWPPQLPAAATSSCSAC